VNLYLWTPWRQDDTFTELGWKSLLAAIALWNALFFAFHDSPVILQTIIVVCLVVLILSGAAEATGQGAVVAAVDWALDFSRAVLAVAVAILFQLALVQENCGHPNVVVRVLASVVFVLTYWLVGRYLGTSMRDSVGPAGHAWLHGPNQTNLSRAVSVVWGVLSATATLYVLTSIIFGPDFIDNSLVFRWIGAAVARSPAANDLLEGLESVLDDLQGCSR
jgi:hypothetical protein